MLSLLLLVVVIVVVLGVLAALGVAFYKLWQAWTVIVPPNQTAVVFGLRGKTRFIRGGGKFVNRLTNRIAYLSHTPLTLPCDMRDVFTEDNHQVNVSVDGTVRIGTSEEMLATAASQWPGARMETIQENLRQIMDGFTRGIVATMPLAGLRADIPETTRKIRELAVPTLAQLGIELLTFTVQSIEDSKPGGALSLLADKQLANVKRDVEISTANAMRDATVNAAQAKMQSAEAENTTRVRVAELAAQATAAEEQAKQAPLLAAAEAQKAVIAAQVANAVSKADGDNLMARNKAASDAQADAQRRKIEAEAEAQVVATMADADLTKALKQAEGTKALADAQNAFSSQAIVLQLLPQLLPIVQSGLEANARALSSAHITLVDSGNGGASSSLNNLFGANLASVMSLLESQGVDLRQLLQRATPPSPTSQNGKVDPTSLLPVAADSAAD